MRKINWDNYQAKTEGGSIGLPAGAYVCRITDMQDAPEREYVRMTVDVAEGEHAGHFSDDWGKAHPWGHSMCLSYKESALGMTKGRLQAISDANPGFDAFAAWDAGRLDMFELRIIGVVFREEEYEAQGGEIRTSVKPDQLAMPADVREGKVKPKPCKRLKREDPVASVADYIGAAPAKGDESDLPF